MHELLDFLLKYLIPDQSYEIVILEDDMNSVIKIITTQANVAKIIGKGGRMIKALKTFVKAASHTNNVQYDLQIEETE
ncbi:MAG: KH domain-containing protein [Christensenellaceae bacterium]|nr:KH domain-containing protein [Christensenellaceae bacterium]